MHFVVCKAENFKILLAPSPKYTGLRDEAPRFMGEGLFICLFLSTMAIWVVRFEFSSGGIQNKIDFWTNINLLKRLGRVASFQWHYHFRKLGVSKN